MARRNVLPSSRKIQTITSTLMITGTSEVVMLCSTRRSCSTKTRSGGKRRGFFLMGGASAGLASLTDQALLPRCHHRFGAAADIEELQNVLNVTAHGIV